MAERLKNLQLRLAMAALFIMMIVIVLDVALRHLLGKPIHGAYDLVEVCLMVFVFHGFSACFLARKNIVIDLIDNVVSERWLQRLIRFSDIVTIGLLGLMIWAMMSPARQAYDYGDKKLELGLPLWLLWVVAIAGFAGTLVCSVFAALAPVMRRREGGPT